MKTHLAIDHDRDASSGSSTDATTSVQTRAKKARYIRTILTAILIAAAVVYLKNLNHERFGGYHDDGIYVSTAKAMATGQGYRIISLPYSPAETKYPPLYPFLLSLIWKANPNFPQNLTPMTWLSIAATLGFLAFGYRYLVEQSYATELQALIITAMSAFNAWTMVFSVSLISEMPYAALAVLGLYLSERYTEQPETGWLRGTAVGVVSGLAFLTRTSGITLVAAIAIYLALRRGWRRALVPVAVAGLVVICWVAWCYFNRTTVQGVNVAFYTNYVRDVREVIASLQSVNNSSEPAVWFAVLGKNLLGLVLVSIPLVCSGLNNIWKPGAQGAVVMVSVFFVLVIFMLIATNVGRRAFAGGRLLYLYLLFYLALHIATPYTTYDRYLAPILPFLLLFLVTELARLITTVVHELRLKRGFGERFSSAAVALAVFATVIVIVYGYAVGFRSQ